MLMDYMASVDERAGAIDLGDWSSICVWDVQIPVRIRVVEVRRVNFRVFPPFSSNCSKLNCRLSRKT